MKLKALSLLLVISAISFAYTITAFNDSASFKVFSFEAPGYTNNIGISVPKNATVFNANLSLEGLMVPNVTNVTSGSPNEHLRHIQMINSTLGFMIGIPTGIGSPGCQPLRCMTFFKYNGRYWYNFVNFDAMKFAMLNETYGWAINGTHSQSSINRWKIWHFNGTDWYEDYSNPVTSIRYWDVSVFNETLALAVAYQQAGYPHVYRYNESGDWNNETLPEGLNTFYLYDSAFANGSLAFVVGNNGYIMKWDGSSWSNETNLFEITDNDLIAIDMYDSSLGFAVGQDGVILRWNGTKWANDSSPVFGSGVQLTDVDVSAPNRAYAVGSSGTFLRWNGSEWSEIASSTTENLWGVSDVPGIIDYNTTFAVGDNLAIVRYWGYPNRASMGVISSRDWNQTGTELVQDTADLKEPIQNYVTSPNCAESVCSVPLNLSIESPGIINISNVNVNYGTTITGAASGLSFNLINGTSALSNAVPQDSDVYVYSGLTLIARIGINFSLQPNYAGWTAEAGVSPNSLAYAIADPLSDAANAMNTSQKAIYVKAHNTGTSKVCVIDDPNVTVSALSLIIRESQCTSAGGTILSPSTVSVNGVTYFEIPNVENSGAIQVIRDGSTVSPSGFVTNPPGTPSSNNAPFISVFWVSPLSGNTTTQFTYYAEIIDPDNDTITNALVFVDGQAFKLNEMYPSDFDTRDGKAYYFTTTLGAGEHDYQFKAMDGIDWGATVREQGPSVKPAAPQPQVKVPVTAAPGYTLAMVLLVFAFSVILVLGMRKNK
ncbi:MAG: YCF48-related protein [archaeon]